MKRFRKQALAVFAALCMLAALGQPDVRAAGGQVRVTVENTTFTSKNADGEDPPWSGTLVDTQVPLTEGMSMMDAIVKALAGYEILGADKGYITTIHGLAEFDNGNQSGWVGTLDGWFTNRGFQAFTTDNGGLEDGDEIRVMYTSKAGDTGNSWEDTSTRLQAVAASAGTLVPGFDSETFAYTLFLPAGTGEVNIRPTAKNNSFAVRVYKGQDPDLSGRGYKPAAYIPVSGGDVVSVVSGYTPWTQIGNTDVTGGFHTLEGEGVSHYRITIAYGEPPEGTATPTPAPTTVVTATPEPTTVVTTTPTPTTVVTTTPTPTTAGTTTPAPTTTTTPTPAPTAIVTATPAPTATVAATATPAAIATPAATADPTPGSGTNAPGTPVGRPAIAKVQTAAYNKLQVTWNRTAGAQGYEVARSFSKNSGYQVIRTIPGGTQTACTDTALDTGRTYYYKVRAYRAVNGNRIYSSYSAARAGVPQLDRPTLKAAAGKGRAKLKWNRVKGANGYLVYRAASKNGTYKKLKTVQSSPAVSYTDKKLKAGKVYFYKIKAYRTVNTKKVYSPFSAPKRVEGE